jgi:glutaminyl-tRNA synthetase
MEAPSKGYFRLYPGNQVRLKYGFVVRCTGYSRGPEGRVDEVHCDYLPETRSGTPGADAVKVKGNIHWVSVPHAFETQIHLYDRLFNVPNPGKRTGSHVDDLNPNAKVTIRGYLEPSLKQAKAGERFQFERHGYFVMDHGRSPGAPLAFNRTVTLRDSWSGAR